MRNRSLQKLAVLLLAASVGTVSACVTGTGGAPPTDISPQPQAALAEQIQRADRFGDQELVDLVLECHNIDKENDAIAKRNTPVLED